MLYPIGPASNLFPSFMFRPLPQPSPHPIAPPPRPGPPRYSGFIALYPIGVASELTMAWLALPTLKATGLWSITMPNAYNFAFSYYITCILVMLTYIPGGAVPRSDHLRHHLLCISFAREYCVV